MPHRVHSIAGKKKKKVQLLPVRDSDSLRNYLRNIWRENVSPARISDNPVSAKILGKVGIVLSPMTNLPHEKPVMLSMYLR